MKIAKYNCHRNNRLALDTSLNTIYKQYQLLMSTSYEIAKALFIIMKVTSIIQIDTACKLYLAMQVCCFYSLNKKGVVWVWSNPDMGHILWD
jgi:hypothetical protein